MGKTIIAEDLIQSYVNGLLTSQQGSASDAIGLIVGQCTSQKDYAVYMVPTPHEEGEEEEGGDGEEQKPIAIKLQDVSEHWVAEHARQVTRMLPGGLSIIGIYANANTNVMRNAQAKLRQVLFATYKALKKQDVYSKKKDGEVVDWAVLQIDATTRKLTCQTIDVADPKSTARPADWKYQSFLSRWPYLHCRVHVDITIPLTTQAKDCSQYSKQLATTLTPFVDIIYNSIAVINGQLKNLEDTLEVQQTKGKQSKKKGGGSGGSSGESSTYAVELLAQNSLSSDAKVTQSKCSACSHVHGAIHSRAYVHNKATVAEAIHAVKEDVVRSLQSRFELLSEDLRQSSSEKEVKELEIAPPTLIATPRRIFTKLPGTHLSICDYVFKDETPLDSLDRLQELFSLQLAEDDLELGVEHLPDDTEFEAAERSCESQASDDSASEIMEEKSNSNTTQVVGTAVGIAGAAVAAVLSYLALNQE